MNDPNNPNLYTYVRNNPLIYTDPSGNLSLKEIINYFKSMFGIKDDKKNDKKDDKKDKSNSNTSQTTGDTTTDTTQYHGEQPNGDPVGYQEFPGPPPVRFPIYKLDQLPESEQWKYVNQVAPNDNTIMYIPPGMENAKISEHFTIGEFAADVAKRDSNGNFIIESKHTPAKDGKSRFIRLDPQLITELEQIRAENGGHPMTISEGYRTVEYNMALTAAGCETATRSPHTSGVAADFTIAGVLNQQIQQGILNRINGGNGIGRVGKGKSYTHYDIADLRYGPNSPYNTGNTWGYSY